MVIQLDRTDQVFLDARHKSVVAEHKLSARLMYEHKFEAALDETGILNALLHQLLLHRKYRPMFGR